MITLNFGGILKCLHSLMFKL